MDKGVLVHLPIELQYLVEPALTYGRFQFDADIFAFLEGATKAEKSELRGVADHARQGGHFKTVNKFLDRYEITEYQEAACLYFLFLVLDYAGLEFD